MNPAKILIVDDDPMMRGTLAYKLKKEGYVAETAEDGERAIEKLETEQFDLIISDVMMPFISGFELLQILKDRGNTVPILILTAMTSTEEETTALDLGAYDFISKPFSPREVSRRIRQILERHSSF